MRLRLPAEAAQFALYAALAVLAGIVLLDSARDTWRTGYHLIQGQNYAAAQYLKENTEPDARVAAFNAGVIGYFSDRTVINLDGVVNSDAFDALQDHRLLAYVQGAGSTMSRIVTARG